MRHEEIGLVLIGLTACSGAGPLGHDAGPLPDAGDVPAWAEGGPGVGDHDASGARPTVTQQALTLAIQDYEEVTVEIVTVACPGDCVEVEAVAHGGFPPYRYRWSDGVTGAARTLCPEATVPFTALAEDTGVRTPEFTLPPATATAEVTARVLACELPPDGGTPHDAGSGDGGTCERLESSFCSAPLGSNDIWWTAPFDETGFSGGGRLFQVHLDTQAADDQIFTVYQDATMCGAGSTATEFTLPAGATITQPLCLRPLGGLASTSWVTLVARPADPFTLSGERGFGGSMEACGSCP